MATLQIKIFLEALIGANKVILSHVQRSKSAGNCFVLKVTAYSNKTMI